MDKVALVISFDEPQDEGEFRSTIGAALQALKPTLEHTSNRHMCFVHGDQAELVLLAIGVGDSTYPDDTAELRKESDETQV